jgi:membrane protein DedA with SNARE-associated domain
MVFFGRFVALLRALAALLAGANRMPWGRFLVFNAAGGVCWASLFGFGAYELGAQAEGLASGLSLLFLGVAVGCGFFLSRFLRRNEADLLRRAEAAIAATKHRRELCTNISR